MPKGDSLMVRLFANVTFPGDCWRWNGLANPNGYGMIWVSTRLQLVHRVSHELFVRPFADEEQTDHLCRNRWCFNPAHLEAVTLAENMRRRGESQTACRRAGHDFSDPRNVYIRPNGQRCCIECVRIDRRAARARRAP